MQSSAKSKKNREKVGGLLMLSSCLELEEKRRRVEGTNMQTSCLEQEELRKQGCRTDA